jgi:hypothetical protein
MVDNLHLRYAQPAIMTLSPGPKFTVSTYLQTKGWPNSVKSHYAQSSLLYRQSIEEHWRINRRQVEDWRSEVWPWVLRGIAHHQPLNVNLPQSYLGYFLFDNFMFSSTRYSLFRSLVPSQVLFLSLCELSETRSPSITMCTHDGEI